MAADKKETWLNWLAVTTVIFSACATLSSFRGSSFSTRAIMAQTNAANQWAYFQSKSVKQHTCEIAKDQIELQLNSIADPGLAEIYRKRIGYYSSEIGRYDTEKAEALVAAKAFEKDRSDFQEHSAQFAMGVVYLQVAIVLSALAALIKMKPVWLLGVVSGAVGLFYFWIGIFWKVIP